MRGDRRRIAGVAAALVLLAGLWLPSAGLASAWSPPQTLFADLSGLQSLDLAAAGDGAAVMAWTERTPQSSASERPRHRGWKKPRLFPVFAATTSAGPPFGSSQQLGFGREVRVAMAADGTAVVVWRTGKGILAAVKPPGAAFGPASAITPRSGGEYELDMSSSGVAAIAWWHQRRGVRRLFASVKEPGAGFSAPRRLAVTGPTAGSFVKRAQRDRRRAAFESQIDVGEGGGIVLAWSNNYYTAAVVKDPAGPFGRVQYLRGVSGSTSATSAAVAPDGSAMVLINGDLDAGLVRAAHRPAGGRFGRARVIGGNARAFGSVFAENGGEFIAIQQIYLRSGRPNGTEIRPFTGGIWGSPVHLFPPGTWGELLATSPSGAAVVGGSDISAEESTVIASYRPPGGAFEAPVTLSTAVVCTCLYEPLAEVDTAGNAWVGWTQGDPEQLVVSYRPRP